MDLNLWNYLVCLRGEIISAISGISDARGHLWWDDTTPNSTTRSRLRKIIEDAVSKASPFGIYVVTRHIDCGSRNHAKASDENGYVWSDPYGLGVEWQDSRFVWRGEQLFQGKRYDSCPCSKNNYYSNHYVIDDFIYDKDAFESASKIIPHILCDIYNALEKAEDKMPRSGIREHLLRALIILNDTILPAPVEDYIKVENAKKLIQ